MARLVQKFGGSSVADADGIKRVARRVVDTQRDGNQVVVVISAMGDTTDELLDLAHQITPTPPGRELDMLLTTGERQSAALLAMAIDALGAKARSYTGSQAGVITTSTHGDARILDITPGRIMAALAKDCIVIVAGFQGVAQATKDITTLGRGASDTTAVALASAIGADYCEIYTDVDGVFTADPRIVAQARPIAEISYDEMLELAACGAKILHLRSVEYARRDNVPVRVRSSFSDRPGTWIRGETNMESKSMEAAIISGVAFDSSQSKVTVVGVPDTVGKAADLFDVLAATGVNLDMVVQNASVADNTVAISFTLPDADRPRAIEALRAAQPGIGFDSLTWDDAIGKVSVIGIGMRSHPGVTATFFRALADAGINLGMISTSEIRISVVVREDQVAEAVRAAHTAFGFDSAGGEAVVYAGTGR